MARITRSAGYVVMITFFILFVFELGNKVSQSRESEDSLEEDSSLSVTIKQEVTLPPKKDNVIKIATVVCSKPDENNTREEAALMMKSVIMSTIMYKISRNIEFHLFLEHKSDAEFFLAKLEEYGDPFQHIEVDIMFHSAIDAFPKKYHKKLLFIGQFRCMYVRIFFPFLMPNVDSVMYFDTDVVVTGNIADVWSYFYKMNNEQLVAAVANVEADNPRNSIFFSDIPYLKPKGFNSGVLLMNLTRMKEHHWTEKLLRIYTYYKRIGTYVNDQKLINVLLYYEPEFLLQLPCQFNFWVYACYDGFFCDGAIRDPNGIQILHGANSSLEVDMPFYEIKRRYENFKLSHNMKMEVFRRSLMEPIRRDYRAPKKAGKESNQKLYNHNQCDGVINQLLFRNFFPSHKVKIAHGTTVKPTKIPQNTPKSSKIFQNTPKSSQILQNTKKSSKISQNTPKSSKNPPKHPMSQFSKM